MIVHPYHSTQLCTWLRTRLLSCVLSPLVCMRSGCTCRKLIWQAHARNGSCYHGSEWCNQGMHSLVSSSCAGLIFPAVVKPARKALGFNAAADIGAPPHPRQVWPDSVAHHEHKCREVRVQGRMHYTVCMSSECMLCKSQEDDIVAQTCRDLAACCIAAALCTVSAHHRCCDQCCAASHKGCTAAHKASKQFIACTL